MFKNLILRTSYHYKLKSSIKLFLCNTKLTNLIRECSSSSNDFYEIKFKPKVTSKKNRDFVTKQEKEDLESLGLEKYAELFEENLNSFSEEAKLKAMSQDNESDPKQSIYFNKFIDERVFKEHNLEDFKTIYKDDLKLKERIKRILKVYELEKYNTSRVPTELKENDIYDLLNFEDEG